jgi:5-methylcytosine-specific restriction endonuclease McrA
VGSAEPDGSEARSLRERVLARDAYRCVYCAEWFPEPQLTLDHVEPRMRGGDQSEGNLVTACRACNTLKGSSPAWAFLADRPVERANFLLHARGVWPRLRRAVEEAAERAEKKRPR